MDSNKVLVILAPRMTDDSRLMWKVCLDRGWEVLRLPGWRVSDSILERGGQIAIYGEPLFAEAVADQLGLALLEPSIDWLTTVPAQYLRRTIRLTSLQKARALQHPCFVKPAEGKTFEAAVYASGADLPQENHVDGSIPVLCSDIVDFKVEVRCIVRNRKLVALSPYWRDGSLANGPDGSWPFLGEEETEARSLAEAVLSDPEVDLPPSCTVDVGKLADGAWAIIEANPIWGAGLYGCDAEQVLSAITLAIVPRKGLSAAQAKWVSKRGSSS